MSASPTKLDNVALQSLVTEAGKKLRSIRSSAYTLIVNQPGPNAVKTEDIEFVNIKGTDMMKVRMINPQTGKHFYKYYLTEPVEVITVAENDNDFIEPMTLQV